MEPYMQNQLASQDDHMHSFTEMLTAPNDAQKKVRGPTQMREIWGNREKVDIKCNRFGQPYQESENKLANFIGTIVRDGKSAPLTYQSWRHVPKKYKERIWSIILEKFDVPAEGKHWVMKTCGRKLSAWKATLKYRYYMENLSFDEQKRLKDKRVCADQCEHLIKYWATEAFQNKSAKNKKSRANKKHNQRTGTRSFAQTRALLKENIGRSPTRVEMFKVCFTKKDETTTNAETREIISRLQEKVATNQDTSKETSRNDTFSEVMGEDGHGRVRMYGLGVSPNLIWGDTSTLIQGNKDETINAMSAEISDLRSQVKDLSGTLSRIQNKEVPSSSDPHNRETRRQLWPSTYDTPVAMVGDIVNLKSIINQYETIAIGILDSKDPSKEVGGEELGPYFSEVIVQIPIKPNEQLIRPYGQFKKIGQVAGTSIAWPTTFVVSREQDIGIND